MGNVGVRTDGSVRLRVHHFSRADEGRPSWDLWSSDLLVRTDDGLLASAEGITTFRSRTESTQRASGRCLAWEGVDMTRTTNARIAGFTDLFYAAIGLCLELL